jgi:hypothetical protein
MNEQHYRKRTLARRLAHEADAGMAIVSDRCYPLEWTSPFRNRRAHYGIVSSQRRSGSERQKMAPLKQVRSIEHDIVLGQLYRKRVDTLYNSRVAGTTDVNGFSQLCPDAVGGQFS